MGVAEVHGKETVGIVLALGTVEKAHGQLLGEELVAHLVEFVEELAPFLGIVAEQTALAVLLRDAEHGLDLSVLAPVEIAEVGLLEGGELAAVHQFRRVEALADEDVLLLEDVALTERLADLGEELLVVVVAVGVGRVFLHGVLDLHHRRVVARLGVDDARAVNVLNGEVDIIENLSSLAACAESADGDGHAREDGEER